MPNCIHNFKKSVMRILGFFCLLTLAFQVSFGQECDGQRYYNEVFSTVDMSSDIKFGENLQPTILNPNNIQELFLDVYEPDGDTLSARPLIIWAFGGAFIAGSRETPDIVTLSNAFASRGYVCAAIDYRLSTDLAVNTDISNAYEAVLKAIHDMRASIRFFYKDAATTNDYRIDTSRIYLGGVSAGAITALHIVHFDELNEVPVEMETVFNATGGFEGTSGNPGYSEDIAGVVSLCGALLDTAFINPAITTPIVSMHGTADNVVPYGSDTIDILNVNLPVDGSSSIHHKLDQYGIENDFYTWPGAGHTPFVLNPPAEAELYMDTAISFVRDFLYDLVCDGVTSVNEPIFEDDVSLSVYPNPTSDNSTVQFELEEPANVEVSLLDVTGRVVFQKSKGRLSIGKHNQLIEMSGLRSGMYLLSFTVGGDRSLVRLVKE